MGEDRAVSWRDVLVPLLVYAIAVAEAVSYDPPDLEIALLLEGLACLVLVLRRRWPLVAPPVAMVALLLLSRVGPAADELAAPILVLALAAFSLGRRPPDLRGLTVLVPVYLLSLVVLVRQDGEPVDVTDVVFIAAMLFPPYVFGRLMRSLADRSQRLADQAELLARLQATVREDAVAAERARIARELHDVLAHSISAMVVQASAGAELARTDPERAAGAMQAVAETGRRALAETGRLLSLVRDSEGELGIEPDPGVDRLAELVDQFRRSGLEVTFDVEGDLAGLPAGVDLSTYRIAQEALTNALKYAPDHVVSLTVRQGLDAVVIETENRGRPGPSTGSGLGLVGMAERVSVFGGTLEHGFTRDGHFRLRAVLPLVTADV